MRSLSQRATVALVCLCVFFALAVTGVGVVGIVGVRSATDTGKLIAGDEVVTFAATAQIARSMDAAYAVGEEALLTGNPALAAPSWPGSCTPSWSPRLTAS